MLRVTSGTVRGFKLDVPKVEAVRPPLEMARQAIFNILGQDLEGFRAADLFAGSGVMGIEALSRGASAVLFVELDRAAVACIRKNLEKTRMSDKATVVPADAFHAWRYIDEAAPLDLVFLDPPFELIRAAESRERVTALVDGLFESPALAGDAVVILRVPKDASLEPLPARAVLADDRVYGQSRVLFFERAREGGEGAPGNG